MNDFANHLTTLLDDVAAGINPQPDFDAVRAASVPVVPNTGGARVGDRFRGVFGIAAASLALVAGGVAAYQVADDGSPTAVLTSDSIEQQPETGSTPLPKPDAGKRVVVPAKEPSKADPLPVKDQTVASKQADAERSAQVGGVVVDGDRLIVTVIGTAAPGEPISLSSEHGATAVGVAGGDSWSLTAKLSGLAAGAEATLRVTFGWSDQAIALAVVHPGAPIDTAVEPAPVTTVKPEEPKHEEPKVTTPAPSPTTPATVAPIAFTSRLKDVYQDDYWMKPTFFGTAPVGAKVTASSDWGSVETVAGAKGQWEMRLKLTDVPDGTVVVVEVWASTGGSARYELVRDKPEPQPKPFTSELGSGYLDASPMKQGFWGTGTPGSVVLASSPYGSAEAVVGANGHWEMWLKMYEVPAGTVVPVQITNNASDAVYRYELQRPHAPAPKPFTANAAFETCDSNPAFNEYWGTAPAGAVVKISSPYGGAEFTANEAGEWEKRVEFPGAPVGETFVVKVTSGGVTKEFALKRVEPG